MSEGLVEWLRLQLLIDEEKAKAATPGPWWDSKVLAAPGHHTIRGGPSDWRGCDGSLPGDVRPIARIEPAPDYEGTFVTNHDADAEHIANWDPSRVLREVEAKRKILDLYATEVRVESEHDGWTPGVNKLWGGGRHSALHHVVQLLAAVYSDRPGYREEWRP